MKVVYTRQGVWFEIISEFLVNIAAGWFAVVFIEPQLFPIQSVTDFLTLTLKFLLGILSLFAAKYFREKAREI